MVCVGSTNLILSKPRPGFLCACALACICAFGVSAQEPYILWSDGTVEKAIDYTLVPGEFAGDAGKDGLTFHLYVSDAAGTGFRQGSGVGQERLDRVAEAFDYVADVLNETGEVDVILGSAEPGATAIAQGGCLYSSGANPTGGDVFDRVASGVKPSSDKAEMALTFNWNTYAWYAGTGTTDSDKLDLLSVAVHEITHALGFISLIQSNGTGLFGNYTHWDGLLAKANGTLVLSGTPPVFSVAPGDLTGNNLVFKGAAARTANGNAYPPVVCASPFQPGTSLQHWRTGTISGSHVMEPAYAYGAMKRFYSPVDIAALRDIGWTNAEAVAQPSCPLATISLVSPAGNVTADSLPAAVALRAAVTLTENSACSTPPDGVRVEYFVDNVSQGASTDRAGQFPLTVNLAAGSRTIRTVATLLSTSQTLQAQRTIQVIENSPVLEAAPAGSIDFGAVKKGETAEQVFTVENAGTGTLTGAASLTGDPVFEFSGPSTYSLGAGQTAEIRVVFTPPEKNASYSATLNFSGPGGSGAQALLAGGSRGGGFLNCSGKSGGVSSFDSPAADAALLAVLAALLAAGAAAGRKRRVSS